MNNVPGEAAVELIDVAVPAAFAADFEVLERVNWRIAAGEYWVIAGLPGSGKTDLLCTAAGLIRPLRGELRLFGRPMSEMREDEAIAHRLRIGMVFGNEGRLFNSMTVAENVALPLCYHQNHVFSAVRDHVNGFLEWLGLDSLANSTPAGMVRNLHIRVALARALVLEPDVLFLDNPLRGLDPRETRWWIQFLRELSTGGGMRKGRRIAIAIATDDIRPLLNQADRFALVHEGEWSDLGDRNTVALSDHPAIRDMLVPGFPA